jgi:putative membrane protein
MPYHVYFPGDFFWVGGLFGLLIVVAIVVGVILVVRQFLERPQHVPGPPPIPPASMRAVEELDLRYARGEIDRPEYLQRRADLMHGGGPHVPPAPHTPPAPSAPPPPKPPGT